MSDSPVVFLQGARQTGKTTLVRHLPAAQPARHYLTLDDATLLAAAESDPRGFINGLVDPVTIDEVQRAPGLALAIKAAVDQNRAPGRFLLTGSAGVLVLPKLSESLVGRMEIHTLWPLSQGEIAGTRDHLIDRLFSPEQLHLTIDPQDWAGMVGRIVQGGYPEMLSRALPQRRESWFGSYITTILQRDVRDLSNIENLAALPRLLALAASRSGSLVNYTDLSRTLWAPVSTLKRHLALFEATFLVKLLPAWFTNLGKRLSKSPKLLINDTGLLAHLLGVSEERLVNDRSLAGHLLENFVAMELIKQSGWSSTRVNLFHYHTHDGDEVDLVLEDSAGRIVGVEVKSSASVRSEHLKGLRSLQTVAGDRFIRGVVLYLGAQIVPFSDRLAAVPVSALWQE